MSVVYSNDFEAETVGSLPSGWQNIVGAFSVQAAGAVSGSKSFGSTAHADGDICIYSGVPATSDHQWTTSQRSVQQGSAFPLHGHNLRFDGAGANGYTIVLANVSSTGANALLFKRIGGAFSLVQGPIAVSLSQAAGDVILIRSKIVGQVVSLYIGNGALPSTPTVIFDADASVTSPGYAGIYNAQDGTTLSIQLDDVSLDNLNTAARLPNDVGIQYSPYNWDVNSTRAKSVNPGAYFRTVFTGTSCTLNFDMTNVSTPYPRLRIRVDGRAAQSPTLAASVVVTMPTDQDNTKHLLEVDYSAASETVNRWNNPQNTAVLLTGILLATGADVLSAPQRRAKTYIAFGDSIDEGVRTLALNGASSDVDRNEATLGLAYLLRTFSNAEIGVVGFGGSGISVGGSGNVPKLSASYTSLWAGQARLFTPAPDLCIWLEGTNDGTANTQADGIAALNGMLSSMPNTKFVLLRPLKDTSQEANLQAIAAGCSDPTRVTYISTAGFWSAADSSDGLHPYGWTNLANVAPRIASSILAATGEAPVVTLPLVNVSGSFGLTSTRQVVPIL